MFGIYKSHYLKFYETRSAQVRDQMWSLPLPCCIQRFCRKIRCSRLLGSPQSEHLQVENCCRLWTKGKNIQFRSCLGKQSQNKTFHQYCENGSLENSSKIHSNCGAYVVGFIFNAPWEGANSFLRAAKYSDIASRALPRQGYREF
jgi:hypothetical protein